MPFKSTTVPYVDILATKKYPGEAGSGNYVEKEEVVRLPLDTIWATAANFQDMLKKPGYHLIGYANITPELKKSPTIQELIGFFDIILNAQGSNSDVRDRAAKALEAVGAKAPKVEGGKAPKAEKEPETGIRGKAAEKGVSLEK